MAIRPTSRFSFVNCWTGRLPSPVVVVRDALAISLHFVGFCLDAHEALVFVQKLMLAASARLHFAPAWRPAASWQFGSSDRLVINFRASMALISTALLGCWPQAL